MSQTKKHVFTVALVNGSWSATNITSQKWNFISNKSIPFAEGDVVEYEGKSYQLRTVNDDSYTLWYKSDVNNSTPDEVVIVHKEDFDKVKSKRPELKQGNLYVGRYISKTINDVKRWYVEILSPVGKTYKQNLNKIVNKHKRRNNDRRDS